MEADSPDEVGPDLAKGISLSDFGDRQLLRGHVDGEAVVLARVGKQILAVGANCTHYGGPLAEGLVVGETVRCPWHNACFSLRSGEALGAPAFDPLPCWGVQIEGDRVFVRGKVDSATVPASVAPKDQPTDIVIVGGGAAGFACAQMLRRRGYSGRLVMLSDDEDAPYDRPNVSKDFLAGTAPPEWMPLRADEFYKDSQIDLHLATTVERIDIAQHEVTIRGGRKFTFDRLLLATGAQPVILPIPGATAEHVFTLRSLADGRAIAKHAQSAKSAVILGSGFIGLEAAASLRARGLDVHVVSLDKQPLQAVLGAQLGALVRDLHEEHGVVFHMGTSIQQITAHSVVLDDGLELAADLVIIGVGVRPRIELAEQAGLQVDRGIVVSGQLETSTPGVFAAGDVARWPGAQNQSLQRIEHWVVAERQGQVAAENMLGAQKRYDDVPFFWSVHYDVTINYAGHASSWDTVEVEGDVAARNCLLRYKKDGQTLAVAGIGRDIQVLEFAAGVG